MKLFLQSVTKIFVTSRKSLHSPHKQCCVAVKSSVRSESYRKSFFKNQHCLWEEGSAPFGLKVLLTYIFCYSGAKSSNDKDKNLCRFQKIAPRKQCCVPVKSSVCSESDRKCFLKNQHCLWGEGSAPFGLKVLWTYIFCYSGAKSWDDKDILQLIVDTA